MDEIAHIKNALAQAGTSSSDYDLNPDVIPVEHGLKSPAAVLIALIQRNGALHVILTKRAQHLRHHPGQIAFPGGKIEASDSSAQSASLREAYEEIGLPPENVEVFGGLPEHLTVTGFTVQPILGFVHRPFTPVLDEGEVEEIIYAPLSHLIDPAKYSIQGRRFRGAFRKYYTVPYGPHYIWGATARMTLGLAERISG
ncbi:CoA pyrophosphatase [uncultured Lentibacter sp.]|uniref:NUDIX hydrolase n=1 Tax=uncultured Lentibacter sp. TaxID=1659309 RepID=UPI002631C330|nr:CoA pyrophosphatase [uncultured Lentibacter sp.]